MGGKSRANSTDYATMTPTQEFNARLADASEFYTPKELRTPAAAMAPAQSTSETDVATPAGPVGTDSITTTQDPAGAQPAAASTGDMMAQSVADPMTTRGKTRTDGSLNVTGQV